MRARAAAAAAALLVAAPAAASAPGAWLRQEHRAQRACAVASRLSHPRAGPPIHFSDANPVDVVHVDGRLPRGLRKAVRMTCLYDRRTRRAEAAEGG